MSEWISLIEQEPERREVCLIGSDASEIILMAVYCEGLWHTGDGKAQAIDDVTHWMPMPPPPK